METCNAYISVYTQSIMNVYTKSSLIPLFLVAWIPEILTDHNREDVIL